MRAAGLRYTPKAIDYTRCARTLSKSVGGEGGEAYKLLDRPRTDLL